MNLTCGFVPKVDSQLDVHHRDPIAEGQRRTRIEDVMVLCANCHRLAHATNPPTRLDF
jgi:predicted HNH restriction endonuclease